MSGLGLDDGTVDVVVLEGGELARTHGRSRCAGVPCPLHAPSHHPLREAPLSWLPELQLMMRRCRHGNVHPDPDSMAYLVDHLLACSVWHDCCPDRCCTSPAVPVTEPAAAYRPSGTCSVTSS